MEKLSAITQYAVIVCVNGIYIVNMGPFEDLNPRCSMFLQADLSAEII